MKRLLQCCGSVAASLQIKSCKVAATRSCKVAATKSCKVAATKSPKVAATKSSKTNLHTKNSQAATMQQLAAATKPHHCCLFAAIHCDTLREAFYFHKGYQSDLSRCALYAYLLSLAFFMLTVKILDARPKLFVFCHTTHTSIAPININPQWGGGGGGGGGIPQGN